MLLPEPGARLMDVSAPPAVFEGSLADVSLLVDKFCYHLPLYRQHQRLKDAGITLSRSTLANDTQRAIELLCPVYEAQWQHILQSKVLAMDETSIKAGRQQKGQIQATWYWPIYGEYDEICFTWSASRGSAHIKQQLEGFEGVLLSDGYAAYDRYAKNKTVTVVTDNGQRWNISPHLLSPVKDATEPQRPAGKKKERLR